MHPAKTWQYHSRRLAVALEGHCPTLSPYIGSGGWTPVDQAAYAVDCRGWSCSISLALPALIMSSASSGIPMQVVMMKFGLTALWPPRTLMGVPFRRRVRKLVALLVEAAGEVDPS